MITWPLMVVAAVCVALTLFIIWAGIYKDGVW